MALAPRDSRVRRRRVIRRARVARSCASRESHRHRRRGYLGGRRRAGLGVLGRRGHVRMGVRSIAACHVRVICRHRCVDTGGCRRSDDETCHLKVTCSAPLEGVPLMRAQMFEMFRQLLQAGDVVGGKEIVDVRQCGLQAPGQRLVIGRAEQGIEPDQAATPAA